MLPRIIGEHPLAKDRNGKLKSRIATVFPHGNTIVTTPGTHATQRWAYVDVLNRLRLEQGFGEMSPKEESAEWRNSVDLIVEESTILIRPNPENMPLCFKADDLLQRLVPKHRIKYMSVRDRQVHSSIKRRGECWRISLLPKTPEEMKRMIAASRIAIHGRELYYYSKATGTRQLTCESFTGLAEMEDSELRLHLEEIRRFSARFNRQGNREIDFFTAGRRFSKDDFAPHDFDALDGDKLRAVYESLRVKFRAAVPPEFRRDDLDRLQWRTRMYAALIGEDDRTVSEEKLLGLSSEFYMQIEWLPGGRIEDGELILDSAFELAEETGEAYLRWLCDENCRGFIINFVRQYGDLEYVNIGRVTRRLSLREESPGRRDVYIIQLKQRGIREEIVRIIRMQKWGIREHLDEGDDLLSAIIQSEGYTEYTLDRRLGCRQLGMNLPAHTTANRISERYRGRRRNMHGAMIWSPYFERDYIRGMASDKIPPEKTADPAYAPRLARLLGRAAAVNMIVGRYDRLSGHVVFDDGDEIVIENENGLPVDIVVADQTGTFADYRGDLESVASGYAEPVNKRLPLVSDKEEFADLYIDAFVAQFSKIQLDYRKRRRAFDTLFKHHPRDPAGNFTFRWECVLERLRRADPRELGNLIARHIHLPRRQTDPVDAETAPLA